MVSRNKTERVRKKLLKVLDRAPDFKEIMLSQDSVDEKRRKIRSFLSTMLIVTFDDDLTIPPLEWVLSRDAIRAFRNILATRSERLAGYSVLNYINDLLHKDDLSDMAMPFKGFFAELEHMLRGVTGKTGVYSEALPAFGKYSGRKAARLRSADLSRMARTADGFMGRYPCGLDKETIRRRSSNKTRILKYFSATDLEWADWKWHTKHIIRDADTLASLIKLTDEEQEAIRRAREYRIPFGITPYYA